MPIYASDMEGQKPWVTHSGERANPAVPGSQARAASHLRLPYLDSPLATNTPDMAVGSSPLSMNRREYTDQQRDSCHSGLCHPGAHQPPPQAVQGWVVWGKSFTF